MIVRRILGGVAGIAVFAASSALLGAQGAQQPSNSAGSPELSVEVAKPVQRDMERPVIIPATLHAYEQVDLYAKASGFVDTCPVDIGDRVSTGDRLATLDIPEMKEDLRQAEAHLEAQKARLASKQAGVVQAEQSLAIAHAEAARAEAQVDLQRTTFDRIRKLHDGEAISDQEFDEARQRLAVAESDIAVATARIARSESDLQAARADIEVARADFSVAEASILRVRTLMGYATISAPFDGVVTRRNIDPGDFVQSAVEEMLTPLFVFTRTDRLRVVFEVAETDAPLVHTGTPVTLRIPSLPGPPVETVVARTAVAINPATRTMRVECDLDNPDGRFQPGSYAKATVHARPLENAVVIPSKAVRVEQGQTYVFIVRGDVVEQRSITIGTDDGIVSEVTEGLSGDEWVVTGATSAVAEGTRVRSVPSQSADPMGD